MVGRRHFGRYAAGLVAGRGKRVLLGHAADGHPGRRGCAAAASTADQHRPGSRCALAGRTGAQPSDAGRPCKPLQPERRGRRRPWRRCGTDLSGWQAGQGGSCGCGRGGRSHFAIGQRTRCHAGRVTQQSRTADAGNAADALTRSACTGRHLQRLQTLTLFQAANSPGARTQQGRRACRLPPARPGQTRCAPSRQSWHWTPTSSPAHAARSLPG